MHSPKKDKAVIAGIFLLVSIITAAPLANLAYSQQPSQMGSKSSSSSSKFDDNNASAATLKIQDIPVEKVRVGDIDTAYKLSAWMKS